MIHPIRPVGCFPTSCEKTLACSYPALVRWAGLCFGRAAPCRLSLAAVLRGKSMGLDQFRSLLGVRIITAEAMPKLLSVAECTAEQVSPIEPWKPWPAHPPFIDEVHRWWPSQDWPPPDPPIIIQETIPNNPPYLIIWQPAGGLLDLWA